MSRRTFRENCKSSNKFAMFGFARIGWSGTSGAHSIFHARKNWYYKFCQGICANHLGHLWSPSWCLVVHSRAPKADGRKACRGETLPGKHDWWLQWQLWSAALSNHGFCHRCFCPPVIRSLGCLAMFGKLGGKCLLFAFRRTYLKLLVIDVNTSWCRKIRSTCDIASRDHHCDRSMNQIPSGIWRSCHES